MRRHWRHRWSEWTEPRFMQSHEDGRGWTVQHRCCETCNLVQERVL